MFRTPRSLPALTGLIVLVSMMQAQTPIDLGVYGATATTSRNAGGTDSTSFNAAGLPGIGLGQDGIEYNSHTWHTNLDTLERIVEGDVKKSAVAIAYAVYQLAMSEELLPRFTPETMPRPPAPAAGAAGPAQ